MKDEVTKEFLAAMKEIEKILLLIDFHPYTFEEKGFAYFITYKKGKTIV